MSNIIPVKSNHYLDTRRVQAVPTSRAVERAIDRIEGQTYLRIARVRAESLVCREKLRELVHLDKEAATDHAFLSQWANTLAAGDPLRHDELQVFTQQARFGMIEIIDQAISTFCRDGGS